LVVALFIVGILAHGGQLLEQRRQPFLYRFSHHIEVAVEIAVGMPIWPSSSLAFIALEIMPDHVHL